MNYSRLERITAADEGFSESPYPDTHGRWAIGHGSNFLGGQPVDAITPHITRDEALHELRADLYLAALDAQAVIPRFNQFSHVRKEIFAMMAFQLGRRGLLNFSQMRAACRRYDIGGIAAEMADSAWYRTKPGGARPRRFVAAMRDNRWPE